MSRIGKPTKAESQTCDCQGLEVWAEMGSDCYSVQVSFEDDDSILKLIMVMVKQLCAYS